MACIMHPHYAPTLCHLKEQVAKATAEKERIAVRVGLGKATRAEYDIAVGKWLDARGAFARAKWTQAGLR